MQPDQNIYVYVGATFLPDPLVLFTNSSRAPGELRQIRAFACHRSVPTTVDSRSNIGIWPLPKPNFEFYKDVCKTEGLWRGAARRKISGFWKSKTPIKIVCFSIGVTKHYVYWGFVRWVFGVRAHLRKVYPIILTSYWFRGLSIRWKSAARLRKSYPTIRWSYRFRELSIG